MFTETVQVCSLSINEYLNTARAHMFPSVFTSCLSSLADCILYLLVIIYLLNEAKVATGFSDGIKLMFLVHSFPA